MQEVSLVITKYLRSNFHDVVGLGQDRAFPYGKGCNDGMASDIDCVSNAILRKSDRLLRCSCSFFAVKVHIRIS